MLGLSGVGAVVNLFTFGGNGLLSQRINGVDGFLTFDPSGNTVQSLSSSQSVNYSHLVTGFGSQLSGGSTSDAYDGMGAQWGYRRESGNLFLLGHRYYSSQRGQFLTRDPMGYGGGVNLYGYVGNNPVNESDSLGLQPDPYCVKLLETINNTRAKLTDRVAKYNPREDFIGGSPYTRNGVTRYAQRFVHYYRIIEDQARLTANIAEYNSRCGGRGGPFVPAPDPSILRHPVFPSPNWQGWQPKFLPNTMSGQDSDLPIHDDGVWVPAVFPWSRAIEGAGIAIDGLWGGAAGFAKAVAAFAH